ncbi:MAG: hypothetical protein ACR2PO_01725 [Methyloligellaceae bacterium]
MRKFVVLSGSSSVGKGLLFAALGRFYPKPALTLKPISLYNDRAIRPGEEDGDDDCFRPHGEIEALSERRDRRAAAQAHAPHQSTRHRKARVHRETAGRQSRALGEVGPVG